MSARRVQVVAGVAAVVLALLAWGLARAAAQASQPVCPTVRRLVWPPTVVVPAVAMVDVSVKPTPRVRVVGGRPFTSWVVEP